MYKSLKLDFIHNLYNYKKYVVILISTYFFNI